MTRLSWIYPPSRSIARSRRRCAEFEGVFGPILEDLSNISSIKVRYRGKRVRLIFDDSGDDEEPPVEGDAEGAEIDFQLLRYTDHVLAVAERRQFELLMEEVHGIPVRLRPRSGSGHDPAVLARLLQDGACLPAPDALVVAAADPSCGARPRRYPAQRVRPLRQPRATTTSRRHSGTARAASGFGKDATRRYTLPRMRSARVPIRPAQASLPGAPGTGPSQTVSWIIWPDWRRQSASTARPRQGYCVFAPSPMMF